MKKKFFIQIQFAVGFMIIVMASDVWAQNSFHCQASYQGQEIELAYPSPKETHLASGQIAGLDIEAYDNETSSYEIQITENENLVSSATLPYFADARMQVGHRGDHLTVQCLK